MSRRSLLLRLALLSVFGLWGSSGSAQAGPPPDPLDALVTRVDQAQKEVRTLQGTFVQKNRVRLFRQELTSSGKLLYERPQGAPSRLRWEYLAPDPSAMVLKDGRAHLLMPGRAPQVFDASKDSTMKAIFAELELWLGNGSLKNAHTEYDVRLLPADKWHALLLVPKAGNPLARTFAQIEMRLDKKSLLLSGLLLKEAGGDEKEISFTSVKRNQELPKGAFDVR